MPKIKEKSMKRTLIFTLVLSTFLLSLWIPGFTHAEQHERPIVRLIYFVPSDREAQPDIDAKLDTVIKDTQRFYADQMEAHGFERKTFLYETDASGKAVVHHIKSEFITIDWAEVFEKLGPPDKTNIYLAAVETDAPLRDLFSEACGYAVVVRSGGVVSGYTAINNSCFNVWAFAHELGHIFGLKHDWRTKGKWIHSSDINDPMTTSFCAAEWLDVHPAFNPGGNAINNNTTVKMLQPRLTSPNNAVRLRFQVTDPDGLHQVQLGTSGSDGFQALADCTGLKNGDVESTVEFGVTELSLKNNGRLSTAFLHVIDMNGNIFGSREYSINLSLLLPPSEGVSIPDPHLEVVTRRGTGELLSTHTTWGLPEGAKARLGKGAIFGIAYSPDGTRLAVASTIGTWLYDAQTHQELALFTGHTLYVHSVAFSPNGQILATGSRDHTIGLWDVRTGNRLRTLTGHTATVESVAFSPDGQTLATAGYNSLYLWDVKTGNLRHTLVDTPQSAHSHIPLPLANIAFGPDGKTLASTLGANTFTQLWDVSTGNLRHTLTRHVLDYSVAFSPDGQTLATGSWGGGIGLWDVQTGQLFHTLTGPANVHSVAFSPDGQTLATGHAVPEIKGQGSIREDHENAGAIILWDVQTGRPLHTLTEHTHYITSVAFNPNGQTLTSASADGALRFWDARTGYLRGTITEHTYQVWNVAFSPDGQTLATASGQTYEGSDPAIHVWDVDTGRLHHTLTGHTFSGVAFSPDGQTLATASRDGAIGLWDVQTGNLLRTLIGHAQNVLSISFSPDGQTLATASQEDTIGLWDVQTGNLRHALLAESRYVAFSPDGQTLVASVEVSIKEGYILTSVTTGLWDVQTGSLLRTFTGLGPFPADGDIRFSPDGQTFVAKDLNDTINLWDVQTGSLLRTFTELGPFSGDIQFSPDGQTLAIPAHSQSIDLWDVQSGSLLRTLTPLTAYKQVLDISFSPDGQTLASGHRDGTVLLWDVWPPLRGPEKIREDVNGDGEVNIQDLLAIAAAIGQAGENDADVNGDGEVNIQDLLAVAAAIGEVAAAPAALRQQGAAHLTQEEVQHWLTQAQQLDRKNLTTQRGILFLQYLLAVLTPQETTLLPNYPNPFNPETWIPYQLSEPAEVSLTIYDIQGRVVRDLDLGHQRVGIYQSRVRAAYWDGRNAVGESVASGVYFYTLKAGDFAATRKMLIRK